MSSSRFQSRLPNWIRLPLGGRLSPSRQILLASDTEGGEEGEEEYNEKHTRTWHHQESTARNARRSFWRGFVMATACALILDLILLLSWSFTPRTKSVFNPHPDLTGASANLANEYHHLFDITTEVDFQAPNEFKSTPPGKKLDELWRTFIPKGAGLIVLPIDFAASHGLRRSVPDIHNTSQEVYRIDAYHQLHCLDILRYTIQLPQWNVSYGYEVTPGHVEHCIEAIRQGLLCNPDLTLTATEDYVNFGKYDKHQCRNYNEIYAWTEKNRFRGAYDALSRAIPDVFPSALHKNRVEKEKEEP